MNIFKSKYLSAEKLQEPALRNLFLAPIMGALFLMFLPVIGFVLFFHAIGLKLAEVATNAWSGPVATGNAYLTGAPPSDSVGPTSDAIKALEEEVAKRRKLDS